MPLSEKGGHAILAVLLDLTALRYRYSPRYQQIKHQRDWIIEAVCQRWWGLFTCYRISNVPSSNNDLETFFRDLKHHQRRITGRQSVREFILRYGPFAAFIDYAEPFDDLLTRLRQVQHEDFVTARQALRKVETRLKKLHRFRHHPDEYYRDLETRWERAISGGRS